jgi:hypothetical protein
MSPLLASRIRLGVVVRCVGASPWVLLLRVAPVGLVSRASCGGALALALAFVACSDGSVDTTSDIRASNPATEPERSALPPNRVQERPLAPSQGDAAADVRDSCLRAPPSLRCGVFPQCGCTLAETCDVQDSDGNVACVTAGKAPMGGACVGTEGCAVGLTCVFGACHPFCDNPGTECAGAGRGACQQVTSTSGRPMTNLTVCQVTCDLRDPRACGGTTAAGTGVCNVSDDGTTDCVAGGIRTVGQTCSPTDDCGPALICAVAAGSTSGVCKKWCRVGTADCGGTLICNPFGTKVKVGTVEYGACP